MSTTGLPKLEMIDEIRSKFERNTTEKDDESFHSLTRDQNSVRSMTPIITDEEGNWESLNAFLDRQRLNSENQSPAFALVNLSSEEERVMNVEEEALDISFKEGKLLDTLHSFLREDE